MDIEFVKATPDDIEDLSDLRCEFLSELTGLSNQEIKQLKVANSEYFRKALNEDTFMAWIAKSNDVIIATSGMCFYTAPPNKSCPNGTIAYIQNMYTKPQYRKIGIAKRLFSKLLDEARERGCTKVLLDATDKGRPLYEKFGFSDTKGDMQLLL